MSRQRSVEDFIKAERQSNEGESGLFPKVRNLSNQLSKVIRENGVAMVSGPTGSGKTTAVRHAAAQQKERYVYDIDPTHPPNNLSFDVIKPMLFILDNFNEFPAELSRAILAAVPKRRHPVIFTFNEDSGRKDVEKSLSPSKFYLEPTEVTGVLDLDPFRKNCSWAQNITNPKNSLEFKELIWGQVNSPTNLLSDNYLQFIGGLDMDRAAKIADALATLAENRFENPAEVILTFSGLWPVLGSSRNKAGIRRDSDWETKWQLHTIYQICMERKLKSLNFTIPPEYSTNLPIGKKWKRLA